MYGCACSGAENCIPLCADGGDWGDEAARLLCVYRGYGGGYASRTGPSWAVTPYIGSLSCPDPRSRSGADGAFNSILQCRVAMVLRGRCRALAGAVCFERECAAVLSAAGRAGRVARARTRLQVMIRVAIMRMTLL